MQLTRAAQFGILSGALLLSGCSGVGALTWPWVPVPDSAPPPIAREMRGLWVATVANIDWPSKDTLNAEQQRAELIQILDRAASGGFNAIIFQVRPAGDAVYRSDLEPWAALLTGTQGTDPGYDPLAFAVAEAHARGLELHAWINPFRAGKSADTARYSATHRFVTRRDLARVYGTQVWFDPGEPEVQEQSIRVARDIVERYDVDAIHADDYFYPYQERDSSGRLINFPDSGSYARSGSTLAVDDWRRANVDRFIERMYREVHQIKPAIKVGLSPFGIWRPGYPASVAGLDAYATIYADSRKWLQSGWMDYLAPQLYWAIDAPQQSFPALLDWWFAENTMGRHVWPGLAAYRVNSGARPLESNEIARQIAMTRQRPAGTGHILYNTTATLRRPSNPVVETVSPLYAQRALLPAFPWLDNEPPPTPTVVVNGQTVQFSPMAGDRPRWWYVRAQSRRAWTSQVVFGNARSVTLDFSPRRVYVNAVDLAGNVSPAADWRR